MTNKELKQNLRKLLEIKYPKDEALQKLGTQKQLSDMLEEELYELDKQKAWQYVLDEIVHGEPSDTNKNNMLAYYLLGKSPIPRDTYHKYNEGDYPDVDSDYLPEARETIKQYLKQRWGQWNCMSVATYNVTKPKSAIQDASRIKAIPHDEVVAVTKTIAYNIQSDDGDDSDKDLAWYREEFPALDSFLDKYPDLNRVLDTMLGAIRNTSVHASAFIISSESLFDRVPLIRTSNGEIVVAVPESAGLKGLQPQGFIKFDILGLNHLSIFHDATKAVEQRTGQKLNWPRLRIDFETDERIFQTANRLMLNGIFQMEGHVPRMIIETIKPESLIELSAVNALIRPGCLQAKAHETFARHKKGKFKREEYPVVNDLRQYEVDDMLFKSLKDTHGVILYQEQIMTLAAKLGDLNDAETNKLRKMFNIARKKQEDLDFIAKAKKKYMENAGKRLPAELAEQWWDCSASNASYTFNASHCVSYAILSFEELYLKTFHPLEFFWALLKNTDGNSGTAESGTTVADSKLKNFMQEAKQFGILTLPPDVNRSGMEFSIASDHELIFGLSQVKGIGEIAAKDIIERRPYNDFDDFIAKHAPKKKPAGFVPSKVNKRVIESLILSGALAAWGTKNELLAKYHYHRGEKEAFVKITPIELLEREKDLLNIVFNEDTIVQVPFGCKSFEQAMSEELTGRTITVYGCMKDKAKKKTKSGIDYTLLKLTDYKFDLLINVWKEKQVKIEMLDPGDFVKLKIWVGDGRRFSFQEIVKIEKGKEQTLMSQMV